MILNFHGQTTVNIYSSAAPTAADAADSTNSGSEDTQQLLAGDLRTMAYRVDIAPEMAAALRPREDVGPLSATTLRPREDVGGRVADVLRPREDVGGSTLVDTLRPREDVGGLASEMVRPREDVGG